MSDEKLYQIGQNVASLWGGSLIMVQETSKMGYKFTIAENGEIFITFVANEELASMITNMKKYKVTYIQHYVLPFRSRRNKKKKKLLKQTRLKKREK